MKTILIVEDERQLAAMWQRALEAEGHRVVHEVSLDGAIGALDEISFDVVVCDIVMESSDEDRRAAGGLAVMAYIARNVTPQPQIIAVSGATSRSTFVDRNFRRMQSLRAMQKPVSPERLLNAIQKVFAAQPTEQSRAPVAQDLDYSSIAMWNLLGATDGVWDWRVGSDEMIFAPGFRKLLGFDGDDMERFPDSLESLTERFHPDDHMGIWNRINESLYLQKPFVMEYRLRTALDDFIWVRSRGTASFDEDGRAVRMVGSTQDITEQRQAIEERAKFFSLAVNLFAVIDVATNQWVRMSPRWAEIFGLSVDALPGTEVIDRIHGEDVAKVQAALEKLRQGETLREFLVRFVHRDGSHRYLLLNVDPASGDDTKCYATARDITDTEHQLFQAISSVVPEAIYVFDLEKKKFVFQNRMMESLRGTHAAGDRTNLPWMRRQIHPDDVPRLEAFHSETRHWRDGQVYQIDFQMRLDDPAYHRYSSRGAVFRRDHQGNVTQYLGTATNLDELAALRRYTEELKKANLDLEGFAYIASHDLKQPLRGIHHLVEWIKEDSVDELRPESREHFEKLQDRVRRLDGLLDDLLTYSRAGRRQNPQETVNFGRLVAEIVELLAPPPGFTVRYVGPALHRETDRLGLEQVLRNLIGNAIKYRSRDDDTVLVDLRDHGDRVEIEVSDNGIGIAPEFHERIFRMFQKLETHQQRSGSGIGLAIVKRTIESQGGAISLDSKLGEGATFRFQWPLRKSPFH